MHMVFRNERLVEKRSISIHLYINCQINFYHYFAFVQIDVVGNSSRICTSVRGQIEQCNARLHHFKLREGFKNKKIIIMISLIL